MQAARRNESKGYWMVEKTRWILWNILWWQGLAEQSSVSMSFWFFSQPWVQQRSWISEGWRWKSRCPLLYMWKVVKEMHYPNSRLRVLYECQWRQVWLLPWPAICDRVRSSGQYEQGGGLGGQHMGLLWNLLWQHSITVYGSSTMSGQNKFRFIDQTRSWNSNRSRWIRRRNMLRLLVHRLTRSWAISRKCFHEWYFIVIVGYE